jgi:hypothetical protein
LSPCSLGELAHFIPKLKPLQVRLIVNALVREGQVVKLEGRTDEGRPIFALAGYAEACEKRDHSDLRLARDYGGNYDAPKWTEDV